MPDRSSIEFRLVLTLASIAFVAVLGLLLILPYRLYERDIRNATTSAHRISNIVQAALRCPLTSGTDPGDLISRIQLIGGMQVALAQLEAGEATPGAMAGRGSSVLDDTELRYVSAPVLDDSGKAWIADLRFDLSPMKRESIRLIIDLVLAVALGAAVFSLVVFLLFRRALIQPIRELTRCVEQIAAGEDVDLPRFDTHELRELRRAIEKACEART